MEPQSIIVKLDQLSVEQQECTIYRVQSPLRNVNDKAYEPEIISIGPYHRGKDNLKMLEEHKLRYLHLLLQSKKMEVQYLISEIRREEQKARKCYAEPISLDANAFTEMMVLDGIFIIELVRKFKMSKSGVRINDPIFDHVWIITNLQRDLMLFENQIPFFILLKLFDLVEVPGQHDELVELISHFFLDVYLQHKTNRQRNETNRQILKPRPDKIKYILDLVYCYWFSPPFKVNVKPEINIANDGTNDVMKIWRFINSATGLREANVKFKCDGGVTLFDVEFIKGTMLLAPIFIEDRTESFLRNLIAYEQYLQDTQSKFVTDYVILLNCLINSSRDVEILSHFGIIKNWLGDDEKVAHMFNKLTDSVTVSTNPFIYGGIFDSVNNHCKRKRNKWMAKLRSNYLNSPWAIISIIAAVIILILTVTQTVCSILQVV